MLFLMALTIFSLLVVYQIKHFLADYPLQGSYMLGKFKGGLGWILPLAAHTLVHGLFTFAIVIVYKNCVWIEDSLFLNGAPSLTITSIHFPLVKGSLQLATKLAIFDFSVHFIMDRIKASPAMLGRFKALSANEMKNILSYLPTLGKAGVKEKFGTQLRSNTFFWWALGIDQMVHHLTHYAIIWKLLGG